MTRHIDQARSINLPRAVRTINRAWTSHGSPRHLALATASVVILLLCLSVAGELALTGRATLAVLLAAVLYWAFSDLPDVVVGVAAVVALVVSGAVSEASMLRALGHEFIWLLVVSFAVGAVIRENRLVEWCFARSGLAGLSLPAMFAALTLFITATAFLIPSTSARAAILLPIFLILAQHATPGQRTALGLLFPTVILLSAGASLIGAGAHAVAAQYLEQTTKEKINLFSWLRLTGPFVAATTVTAAATIFFAFVPSSERRSRLGGAKVADNTLDPNQRRSLVIICSMVVGWVTTPLHGHGMATIGLFGLMLLLLPGIGGGVPSKRAFKAVEIELLIFLATTFVLADALMITGAARALSSSVLATMPRAVIANPTATAVILALIGLSAHLLITSRTARVTVLLPTFVVPLVGLGHSATVLVMVLVLSTGFCQTLPVSAKPVGVFASVSPTPFAKADLLKLSLLLLPQMMIALVVYAIAYR